MTDQILVGKTCLVTGGAGGLGKAIATKYLQAGANMVICDVNEERLQQTSTELSPMGPFKAIKTDITSQSEVESLFEQIGKIDVLVNSTNVRDVTKLALRNMLEQEKPEGRIINIVSVAGKAGGAADTAAFYGDKGIRCNALMMGGMQTNISDAMASSFNMEGMKRATAVIQALKIPLCELEEATEFSLHLAGRKGFGIVNGTCIAADNGWTAMTG
ncbi:uncharacterized protein N7484_006811 [Penicillium longicatenatum]|uniref:uncharacterized protein n=1 Tax=Penicillium longicatenatum TaxID=1561947 RepID=UPI00254714EC|nr:uncharacterized protein N7484_006811 [Penicillium longicatenatum]KAJ5638949.1 hypothetical protein N7484_006811 [Penicillium longicatenatum]